MMASLLIPHLTPHPRCLTSLMLSLLQPSIYLKLLAVTSPAPASPADRIMDDTAAQPSCPEDPSLEKVVVSADPDPPGLRRSSRTRRRPARFEDYDTEL